MVQALILLVTAVVAGAFVGWGAYALSPAYREFVAVAIGVGTGLLVLSILSRR
jgi:hypothetical protein